MNWADFHDDLLPELPGIPTDLVTQHLRRTAIDFCNRTHAYIVTAAAVNIVAGTSTYNLVSPDTGTEVVAVHSAWIEENPLGMTTPTLLSTYHTYWPGDTADVPGSYFHTNDQTITLYPEPERSITGGLEMKLILRPTLAATSIVTWLGTRYYDALLSGTKSSLMAMGSKPWSNPDESRRYGTMYTNLRGAAVIDKNRAMTTGSLQVQMRSA